MRLLRLALVLLVLLAPTATAVAAPDNRGQIEAAILYLKTKQLADGGLEGFTPGASDEFTTIRTVLALAAVRRGMAELTSSGGKTPIAFLADRAATYTRDAQGRVFPGRVGMMLTAVVAAQREPTRFAGLDLVADLTATYDPATGAYATAASQGFSSGAAGTINQMWAILGLAAAGQAVPAAATDYLLGQQEGDNSGGWGFGFGGDVDTTAVVVQALIASGNVPASHPKIQQGLSFLRAQQSATGGWALFGTPSPDSTAAAIQAIVAAGQDPSGADWQKSGRSPHDDLRAMQSSTDGSFGGNALGTADAIPGLAEVAFPVPRRVRVLLPIVPVRSAA